MSDDEGYDLGELPKELPERWMKLIEKLVTPNVLSIVHFLPEIVDLIKSSSHKMSEIGLLSVIHSPLCKNDSPDFALVEPAVVTPEYLISGLYADAVRFPSGEKRELAKATFRVFAKRKALTSQDALAMWEAMAKASCVEQCSDEASVRAASRARRSLGIARPRGRPKKLDKNS
jgi:hypothetical protein